MITDVKESLQDKRRMITVVAECMLGALDAGRFAVRNLLDRNAEILLLQTFQQPKLGQTQSQDLSSMLKKIASEELTALKYKLVDEFGILPERIHVEVYEENLSSLLKLDYFTSTDHSFVIGIGSTSPKKRISCRRTINSLVDAGKRPIIIVSEEITLIEKGRIVHFSGKGSGPNQEFMKFMETIREKKNMEMKYPSISRNGMPVLSPETTQHFKPVNGQIYPGLTESESMLRNEIKQLIV